MYFLSPSLSESVPPPFGSGTLHDDSQSHAPLGIRDVVIDRPNLQTSFGFVLQSNTLRPGCMICETSSTCTFFLSLLPITHMIDSFYAGRLISDSPAEVCGQLYVYDEVLAVNGQDVSSMDHGDIVALIKSSGATIRLTVQQPEGQYAKAIWSTYTFILDITCVCTKTIKFRGTKLPYMTAWWSQ